MRKDIFRQYPIVVLFLAVIIFGFSIGYAADQKAATDKTQQSVQVKLPDGLYLFQQGVGNVFSPLFIVKNGKLEDPYLSAMKIGIQNFMKEYVKEKTFNVYVGTEMIGKLSNVKFDYFNICASVSYQNKFLPDIRGKGVYKGKPLPGMEIDNSIYVRSEPYRPQAVLKAVAMPQSFQTSSKLKTFTVTEADKTKAIETVMKHLIPEAMERLKEQLKKKDKENRQVKLIIREKESQIGFIKAIDVDGNGKKDFLGRYYLSASDERKEAKYNRIFPLNILFILWDTGKLEKVAFSDRVELYFIQSGVIDIDQDGLQEIVLRWYTGIDGDNYDEESYIEIMRHDASGWRSIYRSNEICREVR